MEITLIVSFSENMKATEHLDENTSDTSQVRSVEFKMTAHYGFSHIIRST